VDAIAVTLTLLSTHSRRRRTRAWFSALHMTLELHRFHFTGTLLSAYHNSAAGSSGILAVQ